MTSLPLSAKVSADDLLILLAVARTGRYSAAADELDVAHTTISRRISALERVLGGRVLAKAGGVWELTGLGHRALAAGESIEAAVRTLAGEVDGTGSLRGVIRASGTDGFSAYVLAPAAARLQIRHPDVAVEIVTVTRRASQQRSGIDIEVVVGEPQVHRALAMNLCLRRTYAARCERFRRRKVDTAQGTCRAP